MFTISTSPQASLFSLPNISDRLPVRSVADD